MPGFDPRRHPRGRAGRFVDGPEPAAPDAELAADLAVPLAAQTPSRPSLVLPTDPEKRQELAADDTTPPEVLAQLADDSDRLVRLFAADNPATPPEVLALLAADPDIGVRVGVACNPRTPPDVLGGLVGDPHEDVRIFAEAGDLSTPAGRVAELARYSDPHVRIRVARREGLPPGILAELAADDHEWVRTAARANPVFGKPGVAVHAGLLAD